MSKKDRRNRDNRSGFQEDYDLAENQFDDIEDSFTSSLDEFNEEFEQATASLRQSLDAKTESLGAASTESLVDDSVDEDEEERASLISRLKSLFAAIPVGKIGSVLAALPLSIYGALRWSGGKIAGLGQPILGVFRKIGSLMILKGQDEDEEQLIENDSPEKITQSSPASKDLQKGLNAATKTQAGKEKTKNAAPDTKSAVAAKSRKGDAPLISQNEFVEEDEFDEESVPWLGYAIKGAAIVGVLLLGVGGYFGIKTTFSNKKSENIEQTAETSKDLENKSEIAKAVPVKNTELNDKVAAKLNSKSAAKNKSANSVKSGETLKKTASKPSDNPKGSDAPKLAGATNKAKEPTKAKESAKSASPLKNRDADQKKTAQSEGENQATAVQQAPIIAAPVPAKPQGKPTNEKKQPVEIPKPNPGDSFAFAVPDPQADQAAPKTASNPFDFPNMEPGKPQTGPKTGDRPELQSKTGPETQVQNALVPGISDPFAAAIAPAPPAVEASRNGGTQTSPEIHDDPVPAASMPNDLWALPTTANPNHSEISNPKTNSVQDQNSAAFATFPSTTPSKPHELAQESQPALQSLAVPEPKAKENVMQPLSPIAPLQPLASSAPEAFQPLVPSNDSVPGIPHSADSPFPTAFQSTAPQAPKADTSSRLRGRSNSIPPLEPQVQKPEIIPTIPSGDAPLVVKSTNQPAVANHAEGTIGIPTDLAPSIGDAQSRQTTTDKSETGIGIPDHTMPASNSLVFGTPQQSTASPSPEPQTQQLAQAGPHLGSGLQNQMQEFRDQQNQQTTEPQLRFGNNTQTGQGAVRFSSDTAQNENRNPAALLPMPSSPNDHVDNILFGLNPTGQKADNADEIARSLPPDPASPQAVFADVHPGYRSLANNTPAQAQVDSSANTQQVKRENRALLFRQHVEQSVTKSPQATEKYTVRAGDTYMTISNEKFGTHLLYRALAEHNRRLGAAYMPTEGSVIEIPTAEYLQANYSEALSRGARPRGNRNSTGAGSAFQSARQPRNSQATIRYTVQEGDSIMGIATNQLRDSHRWREIVELNSDQIRDVRDIRPGMQILLPGISTTNTANGSSNSFGRR